MTKNKRHEKLLYILSKEHSMKISDLSERLGTSMMTIRRDLDYLEDKKIVKRFHGGVALMKTDYGQPSFYERIEEFSKEKHIIGQSAASLIQPDSTVFFDAGTTTLAAIEHIPGNLEFTAITTGLLTAVALSNKPQISVISIGGNVHQSSYSSIGYISLEIINKFHADLAFISTKAIMIPHGTYEAKLPLIEIKRAIVEASDKVILLADTSKFMNKSMCHAIDLKDIDMIITDSKLGFRHIEALRDLGKEVIQV